MWSLISDSLAFVESNATVNGFVAGSLESGTIDIKAGAFKSKDMRNSPQIPAA